MLDAYFALAVPPDGEPLSFQLPQELRSLQFQCPPGDEDNLVANACLGALFKLVRLEHVLTLLGVVTLEKQLVVVAENLGVLSAGALRRQQPSVGLSIALLVVLALIPLMRPHVWQGAFIPVVPDALADALHCPVPFVMGIPQLDRQLRDELDVVVLDVDRDSVRKERHAPRRRLLTAPCAALAAVLSAAGPAASQRAGGVDRSRLRAAALSGARQSQRQEASGAANRQQTSQSHV